MVPGSVQRHPEVLDRQQEEMNLSYGAELPLLLPVRPDPLPVQQVKDLAEYVAEQVRPDLDSFRQEIHTRVTDAITAALHHILSHRRMHHACRRTGQDEVSREDR